MANQHISDKVSNPKENSTEKSDTDQEIIDQIGNLNIPDEKRQKIIASLEMYSGPIPHPDILKGYQELYPDAAKEIIENGVAESKHRRSLERARQKRRGTLAVMSLIFVFIIAILFIVASFYLILRGHTVSGSIFGGLSFIAILGTLVNNIDVLSKNDDLTNDDDHDQS